MTTTLTTTTDIEALQARIAELTAERDRLHRLAYTDQLTGAANRLALHDTPAPTTGLVALLDLNGFKGVNDTHGHEAGDTVLVDFARFLADLDGDAYRLGGDEFVIVTRNPGVVDAIASWAHPLGVTTSVGVVPATGDLHADLAAADQAMYADKAARKSRRAGR